MTWGKGGSSNVVQVTTRSRRAFSVPAADVEYEPSSVGSKTARTVYSAMDDANNLSLASKRHDRKLLSDIQMRMENATFGRPVGRESRPRWRAGAASRRRASLSGATPPPPLPAAARWRPPFDEGEFEIVFPEKLSVKGLPPCARRAYQRAHLPRAASVPPYAGRPVDNETVAYRSSPGDFIGFGSPLLRVVDPGPPARRRHAPYYVPDAPRSGHDDAWIDRMLAPYRRRHSFAFEDPGDLRRHADYTPQLSVAKTYSLHVPKPYVRRHVPMTLSPRHYSVYTSEVDYQPAPITSRFRASSEPRPFLPSTNLAVKQAKASLNRIERELGMGTVTLDDAPDFDEPIVRTSQIVPVTAVRTGWYRGSSPPLRRRSYNTITSRPPPAPRSTRLHEIEARLETMLVPETIVQPVSLSSLRSRTAEARNKLDRHKVLLDRYLPLPVGPLNEVPYEVEYKFSELVDRMPHLRPRDVIQRASSLPPVSPISAPVNRAKVNQYNDAFRAPPIRPAMSDTRKRAREVLCRTKGDPHYFDY